STAMWPRSPSPYAIRRAEAGDGQAARKIAYGDGDRGHIAVEIAVVGLVLEGIRADEVRVRRVREGAVGIQCQLSVRRSGHQKGGQGIADKIDGDGHDAGGAGQSVELEFAEE